MCSIIYDNTLAACSRCQMSLLTGLSSSSCRLQCFSDLSQPIKQCWERSIKHHRMNLAGTNCLLCVCFSLFVFTDTLVALLLMEKMARHIGYMYKHMLVPESILMLYQVLKVIHSMPTTYTLISSSTLELTKCILI
jgi:hypothetical protein